MLIDESRVGSETRVMEIKFRIERFRLSRTKTKYMRCQFSRDNLDDGDASLDGQIIPINDTFRYLGSMLQSDGGIDEDISHKIRTGWVK
jgi:hypothetical protein